MATMDLAKVRPWVPKVIAGVSTPVVPQMGRCRSGILLTYYRKEETNRVTKNSKTRE
jgi:hypothetical protein